MAFEIETGIPMPPIRRNIVAAIIKLLEPGQSFICEGVAPGSCSSIIHIYSKKTGKTFTQRKLNENQIRIWRVT
jgi:hypothetical protein